MTASSHARVLGTTAGLLWLAHVAVITLLEGTRRGLISDLIQLTLGAVLLYAILLASREWRRARNRLVSLPVSI